MLEKNRSFYPDSKYNINNIILLDESESYYDSFFNIYEDKVKEFGIDNVFRVSVYDHSCCILKLGEPTDRWDSFYLGFLIYNKKEDNIDNNKDFIEKHVEDYIEAWNHYLNEHDYSYKIYKKRDLYDKDGNIVTFDWLLEYDGDYEQYEKKDDCIESIYHYFKDLKEKKGVDVKFDILFKNIKDEENASN